MARLSSDFLARMRQAPFVNPTVVQHVLALLAQLFRYGEISYHAAFVNLATGGASTRDVGNEPGD